MFFEQYGNASNPTLLFIHGAMTFKCFERQLELADKYHLIFYTLPGHGKDSERAFDRQSALSDIIKLLNDFGKKDINIVSFSLGTQIALLLLDNYSGLINKVVLTSPLIDSEKPDERILFATTRLVGYTSKIEPMTRLVGMFLGVDKERYGIFKKEQKHQNVNSLANQVLSDMLKSSDLKNISEIENEVLILSGSSEMKFFRRSADYLNKTLKNSSLTYYEGAGHNIPFKYYKKFNSDLINFIG